MQGTRIQVALNDVHVNTDLFDGIPVKKATTKGELVDRIFLLSPNKFTIHMHHTNQGAIGNKLLKAFSNLSLGSDAPVNEKEKGQERAIDIGSVDRVQKGQGTYKFEKAFGSQRSIQDKFDPNLSLSIIYNGGLTLDLVMSSKETRDEMLNTIRNLVVAYKASKESATKDVLLMRYIWLDVDKDHSESLDENEWAKVLKRINYEISTDDLSQIYRHFSSAILGLTKSESRKGLSFDQAAYFLHTLRQDGLEETPKNPLDEIWDDLFGSEKKFIHYKDFLEVFLKNVQKEFGVTSEYVTQVFIKVNQLQGSTIPLQDTAALDRSKYLDKHCFEVYLNSEDNDIYDPSAELHMGSNMDQPLSHYWINSSHNTYLTGDQLTSDSSTEMYLKALYRGCRCVEIDVWNDNDDKIPEVYHGHTITSRILFIDTIEVIRNYLQMNPTTYPIILSIENHCDLDGQETMAEILMGVLGKSLYIPKESELDGTKPLPSPNSLKGLIVIKGKRPPKGIEDEVSDESSDDDDYNDPMTSDIERKDSKLRKSRSDSGQGVNDKKKKIPHKVSPTLARITLFHGTKFKSWETSMTNPTHHMHSLKENTIRKIFLEEQEFCIMYNKGHMMRIYPHGTRVSSTNYNPVLAWSMGCQLVALNSQTPDANLRINDGFFRQNGNCGFILKSSDLLNAPKEEAADKLREVLFVRVINGSYLPKRRGWKNGEIIDPYVEVTLYDVVDDDEENAGEKKNSHKTGRASNNGLCPVWNQDNFVFDVHNKTVAVLLFTVWDKDFGSYDDFIASAAVPVSCLREGYRSVKLFNAHNTRSGPFDFASLLVKVTREAVG